MGKKVETVFVHLILNTTLKINFEVNDNYVSAAKYCSTFIGSAYCI